MGPWVVNKLMNASLHECPAQEKVINVQARFFSG